MISEHLKRVSEQQLRNLRADTPGVAGAIVATSDGFEVAALTSSEYTVSKLAAMASAVHGLGDAVVKEANMKQCRDVIIDSLGGKIVFMSIPGGPPDLLLMVLTDQHAAFGQLLLACKKCAVALREDIMAHPGTA